MTNKHLKPGVAVDVRGASDEVKEQVMAAFVNEGFDRGPDDIGEEFIVCGIVSGKVYFYGGDCAEAYELISINQALGRESEVEKNDWTNLGYAGEMPKVDQECEYINSSMTSFSRCKYIGVNSVGTKKFAVLFLPSVSEYVESKIGSELKFRPLKTEKAKFVERLVLIINDNTTASFTEISGVLYDKGLRFPE